MTASRPAGRWNRQTVQASSVATQVEGGHSELWTGWAVSNQADGELRREDEEKWKKMRRGAEVLQDVSQPHRMAYLSAGRTRHATAAGAGPEGLQRGRRRAYRGAQASRSSDAMRRRAICLRSSPSPRARLQVVVHPAPARSCRWLPAPRTGRRRRCGWADKGHDARRSARPPRRASSTLHPTWQTMVRCPVRTVATAWVADMHRRSPRRTVPGDVGSMLHHPGSTRSFPDTSPVLTIETHSRPHRAPSAEMTAWPDPAISVSAPVQPRASRLAGGRLRESRRHLSVRLNCARSSLARATCILHLGPNHTGGPPRIVPRCQRKSQCIAPQLCGCP